MKRAGWWWGYTELYPFGSLGPLRASALALVNAINADANYCTSVTENGSGVQLALQQFSKAWSARVHAGPMLSGHYDAYAAMAVQYVLGSAPPYCM